MYDSHCQHMICVRTLSIHTHTHIEAKIDVFLFTGELSFTWFEGSFILQFGSQLICATTKVSIGFKSCTPTSAKPKCEGQHLSSM